MRQFSYGSELATHRGKRQGALDSRILVGFALFFRCSLAPSFGHIGVCSGAATAFRSSLARQLTIISSGANVILTWPTKNAGFTLYVIHHESCSTGSLDVRLSGAGRRQWPGGSHQCHLRHAAVLSVGKVMALPAWIDGLVESWIGESGIPFNLPPPDRPTRVGLAQPEQL